MPKTIGSLNLTENFTANSLLKLAKHQFGYEPFTCQMIYDAHLDYYGSEQRNKTLTATNIAQLMNRGFLTRHPEKSDHGLTMYRVLNGKQKPQKSQGPVKMSYTDILNLIKEHFKARSFTAQQISEKIQGQPDVRFHVRRLEKKGLIETIRRDFRGKHYRIVYDMAPSADQAPQTDDQARQPAQTKKTDQVPQTNQMPQSAQAIPVESVKIEKNQIIDREVLKSLDIPLDLIGEAIVMKISALRRQIDDLETAELTYKRQLDEMQKNAHTQSRIIASLNDKVTALSKEAPRHSKATIANLGEIARISTLKKR